MLKREKKYLKAESRLTKKFVCRAEGIYLH